VNDARGGLYAGKGSASINGGQAPDKAGSPTAEIHTEAGRFEGDGQIMPMRGKVITPEYLNPQTPTGQQVVNLCEEYAKGAPDDLYLEQMPPARRELIRAYFENLRRQLNGGAAPDATASATQPAAKP